MSTCASVLAAGMYLLQFHRLRVRRRGDFVGVLLDSDAWRELVRLIDGLQAETLDWRTKRRERFLPSVSHVPFSNPARQSALTRSTGNMSVWWLNVPATSALMFGLRYHSDTTSIYHSAATRL